MYSREHPMYDGGKNTAAWSWADNKIFEDALVKFPEGVANRWEKIAGYLAGKSVDDVILHYQKLVYDVGQIESGLIELPSYSELMETGRTSSSSSGKRSQCERKKGKPWTVEEHMLFLRGLEIYGKSDWRSISRNVVVSRLPSQVASHAQKYFNRLKSSKKERKRSSIHDITRVSECITIAYPDINTNTNNTNTPPLAAAAMDYYNNTNTNNNNTPTPAAAMDYYNTNTTPAAAMDYYNTNTTPAAMDYYNTNTTPAAMDYYNTNTTPAAMDYYNTNTTPPAMDYYNTNTNTNSTLAAIDCYSNNNCYINNNNMGYINNNKNMGAGVDCHIYNNNKESANINNNAVLDCLEWHGINKESALDCLDLPQMMSNAMSVPAPANPPRFQDFSYPF